jgi:AraC family transcriptional regulator
MASLVANGTYFGRTVLVRHSAGLARAETQYGAGMVVPQHEHETALCVLVLEGGFEEHSECQRDMCVTGTLLFVPAGASHSHRFLAQRSRAFTVQFGDEWTRRLSACDVRIPTRGRIQAQGAGSWKAARLYSEFRSGTVDSPVALDERALETLGAVAPQIVGQPFNERRAQWLRQARDYINAHFRESFSLAQLAQLTGVHPAYLSRAFRRHTGETLSSLVRRLRLEHATERLVRERASVGLIGLEAGFADHSHFTRAFKRATGTTPQAYRELFSPPRARPDPRRAPLP